MSGCQFLRRRRSAFRVGLDLGLARRKSPRQQSVGRGVGQGTRGRSPRISRLGIRRSIAFQAQPQFLENLIEALTLNDLHRIEMHAFLRAHAKDRHDVRMMQPGGGPGFELKPIKVRGARQSCLLRQDLQATCPAQRLLDGLLNDAHTARPISRRIM